MEQAMGEHSLAAHHTVLHNCLHFNGWAERVSAIDRVVVLVVPYVPLFLYRWKRVRDFRETWSQEAEAGNT
jgi:hypothetical protein